MKFLKFLLENILATAGLLSAAIALTLGLSIYEWGGWDGFLEWQLYLEADILPARLDYLLWAGVFLILGLLFFNFQKSIPFLRNALVLRLGIAILLVPLTGIVLGKTLVLILF